ncbi:unnamed protein product, partial [Adineta ricciae]
METNVEGNIHKLRLRLIDSDAKQADARSDEPKKRTPQRSSENHRRSRSKPQRHDSKIERIHNLYNHRYRGGQHMLFPSYSYDSRLYLQPLDEEPSPISSNMDYLIDSMARRRLAFRQFNGSFDQQRANNGYRSPYFGRNELKKFNSSGSFVDSVIGPLNDEQIYLHNEDLIYTNRSSRSQTERDARRAEAYEKMLRLHVDHDVGMTGSNEKESTVKLPPISSKQKSHQSQNLPNRNGYQNHQAALPPISSEHLIKLPSDIYVSPKSDRSTHKSRRHRSLSKETHSENERSGEETDISTDKRHRKESQTSENEFFTEPEGKGKKSTKIRRNPFKKAAFAILFVVFVKHRVHQNRS